MNPFFRDLPLLLLGTALRNETKQHVKQLLSILENNQLVFVTRAPISTSMNSLACSSSWTLK